MVAIIFKISRENHPSRDDFSSNSCLSSMTSLPLSISLPLFLSICLSISLSISLPLCLSLSLQISDSSQSSYLDCTIQLVTCPSCIVSLEFKHLDLMPSCSNSPILQQIHDKRNHACNCDVIRISESQQVRVRSKRGSKYRDKNNSEKTGDSFTRFCRGPKYWSPYHSGKTNKTKTSPVYQL